MSIGGKDIAKAPGHWILARMGKKVLRPGGRELTVKLMEALAVTPSDDVAEFAPGLGFTAAMALARHPRSYTEIELDSDAVALLRARLGGPGRTFVEGTAAHTGLADGAVDKVYGEAMLTMQADHRKAEIVREAFRILRPGGIYAIHELGLMPDALGEAEKATVQRDLATAIRVNARPLTRTEWTALLEDAGFTVQWSATSPMRLLEAGRMVADEGLIRTLRIGWNIMNHPVARARLLEMRRVFRLHRHHINAIALTARRP
ncbi:MAG: class I SAM-dependent methyltransferase [Flavobacteriales bacterium]|jgi:SAM-dependent methyltransferase|nr:class I SAM-dependent methyltransferase [Flavobacteriales bacterium]